MAVGDELLLGDIVNANAAWLGAQLAAAGAPVVHSGAVGDDARRIVSALRRAMEDADVVVTCGGLGPTVDDVTRDAVAALAGVPLDRVPELEQQLTAKFAAYGYTDLPAEVMRQADVPRGATVLDNPVGSAPGLRLELDGRLLLVMPGPPHELAATMAVGLAEVSARSGAVGLTRTVHCAGVGESQVAAVVDPLLDLPAGVDLAYLAGGGIVRVRLTTTAPTLAQAAAVLDPHADAVAQALGPAVFGRDDDTLPGAVIGLLQRRGQTLAVAESLTAGLVGAALTDVAGASAVFRGGVQVYATDLKHRLAAVPEQLLASCGAVSPETAAAMAAGVRGRLGADWGLALTGVAGPDPQEGQPPGTVHLAVAGPDGAAAARSLRLPGDRTRVRLLAVGTGLDLLRRALR